MKQSMLLLAAAALFAGVQAGANVKMPGIFSDNMVLQRETKVNVWGWADNGEEVTVSFKGQNVKTTAKDGKWILQLAPMKADAKGEVLTIKGKNQLTFKNVVVGEVWVCSGQSNMEMPVWTSSSYWRVDNADAERKNADCPDLRLYKGNNYKFYQIPQTDNPGRSWMVCNSESIVGFSAAGYFFGREIVKALKVPVGLISANWGGTRVEPWTSPYGFNQVPSLAKIAYDVNAKVPGTKEYKAESAKAIASAEKWLAEARKAVAEGKMVPQAAAYPNALKVSGGHQAPTVLYNSMIAPIRNFAIQGVLWYQGESNLSDGMVYKDKMKALVASFREAFGKPAMPFYFVQLAPFNYNHPTRLPEFWEAQQAFADSEKNVGMALTNDIGNFRDIHPHNKKDVGARLALLALKHTYGRTDLVADSPFFQSFKVDGAKAVVTFRNVKTLKTKDGKPAKYFEIAGANGAFFPATVELKGNTAILSSSSVQKPYMVRFAWNPDVTVNLVNENNLPAGAFRAGEVPVREYLDATVPEAKSYQVIYRFNPAASVKNGGRDANYSIDNSKSFAGKKIVRVGYFMSLTNRKTGKNDFVFVAMDPFTQDIRKIGLPVATLKSPFQQIVKNLLVKSNVPAVKNGTFADGNIEFWGTNYSQQNALKIPGASDGSFDFGDQRSGSGGYGSMQIHNYKEKQVLFAYNNFSAGAAGDIGIGSSKQGNPDYTFAKNLNQYFADILVLAQFE